MKSLLSSISVWALMVSVVHAGIVPSYLPESSYYQGRRSFSEDVGGGVIISGRVEFAVYTGTDAEDAIARTGYGGDAAYVYAYQVFNNQESDAAMTYFAVTGIDPTTVESDGIDALEDFNSASSIEPSSYGFNADQTKGIWEFNDATLIQGENSWFLFIYSDYDWVAGDIQIQAAYDDDVPVPNGDDNTNIPEPATLLLFLAGVVVSVKRSKRG